ncbi:LCP family protein [Companilactobacillus ginsenosidimutans]|uniref:LytR family transcriptional regulator n=1 Tax=Companilactobacillus ginsenosidimutans TaxID=1007676 RepID=A0A0H4QHH9_9LACO|nr:LCP family protein [Companilactobacillus ginsenosidimutans]AKP67392.1 LytR family transcriptional regulator [Companilactobacillus ginsenosidimutans]
MKKKKKKHLLRNSFIILFLMMFAGGTAYGMTTYRGIKNSVNKSFKSSGVTKQRNVNAQLEKKKPISILLMGTDTGALGRDYQGRTDSMMVLTLNPNTNKTTVTSIPRDTAVNIPGYPEESPAKINSAYSVGQTKAAITTVEQMLNVPIDFYVLINMGGMEKVINQAGGVDVKPTLSFDYEGHSFTENKVEHMDGKKALAYSRMRYDDPDGDYGRQKRQRQVFTALIKKSSSIQSLLNQQFIKSLSDQTQTDLTFDEITALAKDYRSVRSHTEETHLQGIGAQVDNQSMELVKKGELQRVTDFIRKNLELDHSLTGNIQYNPAADNH